MAGLSADTNAAIPRVARAPRPAGSEMNRVDTKSKRPPLSRPTPREVGGVLPNTKARVAAKAAQGISAPGRQGKETALARMGGVPDNLSAHTTSSRTLDRSANASTGAASRPLPDANTSGPSGQSARQEPASRPGNPHAGETTTSASVDSTASSSGNTAAEWSDSPLSPSPNDLHRGDTIDEVGNKVPPMPDPNRPMGRSDTGTPPADAAPARSAPAGTDPDRISNPGVPMREHSVDPASTSTTPDTGRPQPQPSEQGPTQGPGNGRESGGRTEPSAPTPDASRPNPSGAHGPDRDPVAAPAAPDASEGIPTIAEMRARLAEGITIGGQTFQVDANADQTTVRRVFRDRIGRLMPQGDNREFSHFNRQAVEYAVVNAQLAGVSSQEMAADLDRYFYNRSNPQAPEQLLDPGFLGLPEMTPAMLGNPATINESGRRDAATRRDELLVSTIREIRDANRGKPHEQQTPVINVLPEDDVRAAALPILERVAQGSGKNAAEVIARIQKHASAEDLASIVANPGRFASLEKAFSVADLISKRIQYHPKVAGFFGKKWSLLNKEQQDSILAQEQFAALMANAEELKRIEKDYKSRQPLLAILFKLLLAIFGTTAYQLVTDELGQISEGRIQ